MIAETTPVWDVIPSVQVLGLRVDATSYSDAIHRICQWAARGESRTVAAANLHMVMEGHDEPGYQELINGCDLVTPDGMPLVWVLKAYGIESATRVYGPDLTRLLLKEAENLRLPVGFYGGTPQALDALLAVIRESFPNLQVTYACAPPFRSLEIEEEKQVVTDIRTSGAKLLFVGLGCPKQERWIAAHRGTIPSVMLGVGAAFDFLSGTKNQAPGWMQQRGLEWLFRLISEPRRLFWRYMRHNPRFAFLIARQLWRDRSRQRMAVV